jgi:SecD/SecF fusion protein
MVKGKSLGRINWKSYTQKSNIAIVLDNIVYSAPGVSSGPIAGGRSEISGTLM